MQLYRLGVTSKCKDVPQLPIHANADVELEVERDDKRRMIIFGASRVLGIRLGVFNNFATRTER